ncbi:hypothetical protein T06_13308 [Trichinella sp. T6]|nr:hypothetical protein T06_13308 [Trichinella sp. T6]
MSSGVHFQKTQEDYMSTSNYISTYHKEKEVLIKNCCR